MSARTQATGQPLGGCGGRCDFLAFTIVDAAAARQWHDEAIRRMDSLDIEAMLWLIEQFGLAQDGEAEEAQQPYCLTEFTNEHNWTDPVGVKHFARFIESWAYGRRSDEALRILSARLGVDYDRARSSMDADERRQLRAEAAELNASVIDEERVDGILRRVEKAEGEEG